LLFSKISHVFDFKHPASIVKVEPEIKTLAFCILSDDSVKLGHSVFAFPYIRIVHYKIYKKKKSLEIYQNNLFSLYIFLANPLPA
jgi:hypothetical protein